jgi:hypothetical protein
MALRRLAVGMAGTLVLATAAGLIGAGTATAAVQQTTNGYAVPAQPYKNNPDKTDWLGSYVVGGQQVWCVDYALKAPDSNEKYTDDDVLKTKWGTPLDATTAEEISYLLLRYGNTTSKDDAAALAHLLHAWSAPPQQGDPNPYDPNKTYQQIAYNAPLHLSELPAGAQHAVTALQADAATNHGPWTASMAAPKGQQLIGTPDSWTVNVRNASDRGLADVAVTLTATDGIFPGNTTTEVVNTPSDGSPLSVTLTPTGLNPKIVATLTSPAAMPKVRNPADPNMQKIVTTGGTTTLTSTATTTAQSPPGTMTVVKTDAKTGKPISGATFEVTGADKKSPALSLLGAPVVGKDGTPLVLTTNADGKATVNNLRTPQTVCMIETAPPAGYDQAFNPASPPTQCSQVAAGQTVTVSIKNTPNKIPVAIPAGGPPATMTAMSAVVQEPAPVALFLFGGLLVIAAGVAGAMVLRRRRR